jgi:hypothetical protein
MIIHRRGRNVSTSLGPALIAAMTIATGCATGPAHDVAPLLEEARRNEVAAYGKYRDHDIRVTGVVVQTGLDQSTQVVADYGVYGAVTARRENTIHPFIMLGDAARASGDAVRCYFAADEAAEIGKVTRGSRLILRGTFHQYAHDGARLLLVLSACARE